MSWVRLLLVFVATLALSSSAANAHKVPARRTVTVQAEPDTTLVLVTWTSARGAQGQKMLARSAWGRSKRATNALRALASAEALRGLSVEQDGRRVSAAATQVKVRVEKGSRSDPPRVICAVLLRFESRAGSELVVRHSGRVETGMRWFDNSEGAAQSNMDTVGWLVGRRTLRVVRPLKPGR